MGGFMKNIVKLKDCLKKLKKSDLLQIAESNTYKFSEPVKKDEMIEILTTVIPKNFADNIRYYNIFELYFLTKSIKDYISSEEIASLDDTFNAIEVQLKGYVFSGYEIEDLLAMGYVYVAEAEINPSFVLPEELRMIYTEEFKEKGAMIFGYQGIQSSIMACVNLYGYCSYEQILKLHNEFTGPKVNSNMLKEYIKGYSKKSGTYIIDGDDKYIYSNYLSVDEFEMLMLNEMKMLYYNPTAEEFEEYSYDILNSQVKFLLDKIENLLFEKTEIDIDSLNDFEEDFGSVEEVYFDMGIELAFSARMGRGLLRAIDVLDENECVFLDRKDRDQYYKLYLELLEKSRKWSIKGHFYSDL
jgi:hypothetical protein